ncbi:hypothetical protein NCAS_0A07040 [Naumovozyma castellii]|uniref:Trafficking protein particle complex II-specific subunit 65 n=1 Tax=Naumovozyma castellii TaxID=27288 RepID=G0V714_NAUCA|nr:hypothetical protein NCAS_0A07040 [Naumovozyma castellii CBS 4309]CCC67262.1 hypothetical protein NCAS_0A07040 [Naumovozyma castellii CBS 4309]
MELYLPINSKVSPTDLASLKKSHSERDFVIFDEKLKLVLRTGSNEYITGLTVWINDARVLQSTEMDTLFNKLTTDNDVTVWEMKSNVSSDFMFRSSVVMNNGFNNYIRFIVRYSASAKDNGETYKEDSPIQYLADEDDILSSFEPIYSWPITTPSSRTNKTAQEPKPKPQESSDNVKSTIQEQEDLTKELEYPIFSLLNMRLRNTSIKSQNCILSSLDFQTSKMSTQLHEKYFSSQKSSMNLFFKDVIYELIDNKSHIRVDPLCPLKLPFASYLHDSFNICFKLPIISPLNPPHRVRISLIYELRFPKDTNQPIIPVITRWETEVTLKKQVPTLPSSTSPVTNNSNAASTSFLSIPKFYGLSSSRFSVQSSTSTTSLVNNQLNNVKFKFLNNNLKVTKGEKFTLRLQIINSSSSSLDLVVYYNNKTPTNASLSLEKQFQLRKKFSKITEGIILLSNDYKIPIVGPNESYFVDLRFIGIMSGYYSTLAGLKVLDLKSNELIEVGLGASILIQ